MSSILWVLVQKSLEKALYRPGWCLALGRGLHWAKEWIASTTRLCRHEVLSSAHIEPSFYIHSRHMEAVVMAWRARQSSRTQAAAGAGGFSHPEPGPDNWTASGSQGEANWPQAQRAPQDECSLGDGHSEMSCACQPPASFPLRNLAKYRVGMTTAMLPHPPTWRTAWSLSPWSRPTHTGLWGLHSHSTESFPTRALGLLYLTFQDKSGPLWPQGLPPWTMHGGAARPSLCFTHPTHQNFTLLHRPWVAWGDTTLPVPSTHYLPHEQGCTGQWGS